jgi:hypothetical protein
MEDDGLYRTWAGEDSTNDKEEESLVMMIATIRVDELSQPCFFVRWMGTFPADKVNIWDDLKVGA